MGEPSADVEGASWFLLSVPGKKNCSGFRVSEGLDKNLGGFRWLCTGHIVRRVYIRLASLVETRAWV